MKYRCHSRSPSPSSRTYNTYNTYNTFASNIRGVYGMNPIEAISFVLGACTVNAQRCVYAENEHYSPTTPFRSQSSSKKRSKRNSRSRSSSKSKKHQQWRTDFDDDGTEVTIGSSTSSQARRAAATVTFKNRRRSSSRSRRNSRSRSSSRRRDVSPVASSRDRSRSRSHSKSRSTSTVKTSRSRSQSKNMSSSSPIRLPRSSSKSKKSREPLQLHRDIEVQFDDEDPDDDVSAISAGTLEYLAVKQERIAVLNYANEKLKKNQSAPNLQSQAPPDEHKLGHEHTPLTRMRYSFDKENVMNMPSDTMDHASVSAASSGTSEFDSVWHNPNHKSNSLQGGKSSSRGPKVYISLEEYKFGRQNVDNNRSSAGQSSSRKLKVSSSGVGTSTTGRRGMGHYSKWETSSSRKMRRQIQRDGIGSIPEIEGMDEGDDFGMDPFEDADAVNNNSLLPDEEEI